MKSNYKSYQRALETLSHIDQVIFLFYVAISQVKQAKDAIKQKDYDKRFTLINKTCNIVNGLRADLNFGSDNEVIGALDQYYDSMDRLLISVQADNKLDTCDQIIEHLTTIKNQWEQIAAMQNVPEIDVDNDNDSSSVIV